MTTLDQVVAEKAAPKLTSHDLKLGLRRNKGDGHQVFFEVGDDTGTKVTRHADAVSIGIWPSTGHVIHGYEIKVSRGDFLAEMKDPLKAWPVMQYCHRWSLLTPPGLVKVDELPPNWGLTTFDGKTMRAVKQPPMLSPVALSAGFVAALVRRAGEADAKMIEAATEQLNAEWNRKYLELQRTREERIHGNSPAAQAALDLVAQFKERLGVDHLNVRDLDDIAPLLKVVRSAGIGAAWGGLHSVLKELDEGSDRLRKAMIEAGVAVKRK